MAFSKISLNGTVLIDLTGITAVATDITNGETSIGADGEDITGSMPAAVGTNTITGGGISCARTGATNATVNTTDSYTNGVSVTFTGSRAAATATAAVTTAGYAAQNANFASANLAADTAAATAYIQGATLTTPASGTKQFDITAPNGNESPVTFHFSVDANGNTTIT